VIETERLLLLPATAEVLRAEREGVAALTAATGRSRELAQAFGNPEKS